MVPDSAPAAETRVECEVMAAVDSDRLVIANVCRDDAWLTIPMSEAVTISEWQ